MDLQQFDTTLKSALENIEVPFDPSTWAALASKLDQLPPADAVDQALRPSLEKVDASYDAGSWNLLANRMDVLARVRRLRMTKMAEAAILLLLLLNLKGFFGVVQSVTHPAPVKKEIIGPIAKVSTSKSKKSSQQSPTESVSTATAETPQNLTDQVIAFVKDLAQGFSKAAEETPVLTPMVLQPIASNASLLDGNRFYGQSGLMKFTDAANLPLQPVKPLLYASNDVLIPGLEIEKAVRKSRFYAASYGSYDRNYAREGDFSHQSNGYGGGFIVGYRKGKWSLESGIAYAQKNYQPKRQNVEYQNDPFNGISFYYIDEVNADVVSIPVKATRKIAQMGSVTTRAVAGISTHFAANKSYGYKTVHYPPPIPLPQDPNHPAVSVSPNGQGILENGGLTHNVYASADLGIRVEQPLGKHYVAFVEPAFRHSLGSGLGPTATRINTLTIQAGVMASL